MKLYLITLACAAVGVLTSAAFSQSVPDYSAEATFPSAPGNSYSGLVKLPDGSFYGISPLGGEGSGGCVFKVQGGTAVAVASFSSIGAEVDSSYSVKRLAAHGSDIYGLLFNSMDGTGTLWRWSSANGLEHLATIDSTIGWAPSEGIVVTADGTVFGICQISAGSNGGALWKWTEGAGLELVTEFDGTVTPFALSLRGLTAATDGTLYGITFPEAFYDPDTYEFLGYGAAKLWKWTEAGGVV